MPASPQDAKKMGHAIAAALGSQAGGAGAAPGALSASAMGPTAGPTPSAVTPPPGMFNASPQQRQAANLSFGLDEPQQAPSTGPTLDPETVKRRAVMDRITKTLMDATSGMTPQATFDEIGRAAGQAAIGNVTYGDAMNSIRAERLAMAKQMMDVLRGQEEMDLARRSAERADKELAHNIMNSDRQFSMEERKFARGVAEADRGYDLQLRQFAETVRNNKQNYNLATRQLAQQVLSDERNWQLSQEELKLKQAAEVRAQMEAAANAGHGRATAITGAVNSLPEEIRDVYYMHLMDYDDNIEEIDATNIHKAIGWVRRKLEAAGDLPPIDTDASAAEEKVQRIMAAYGVDRRTAVGIADGVVSVHTDPQSGLHTIVDKVTGRGRLLNTELPQPGQPQPAPEGETLTDIVNTGDIAGAAPWLLETWSRLAGQVPGMPVAEETVKNRQIVRLEARNLVRALQNNPRYSEGERKAIEQEIDIGPNFFDAREANLGRLSAIEKSVRRRLENAERATADISLSLKDRQAAARAANDIRNFLAVLGDPDAGLRVGKGNVVPQGSGLTPEDDELINRYLSPPEATGGGPAQPPFDQGALGLTPQEQRIVDYHRTSMETGNVGRGPHGEPVTVYSLGIEIPEGPHKGRFVSVPGWVNGRILSEREAYDHWREEINAGRWPMYESGPALNQRAHEIHSIMDAEAGQARAARRQ